MRHAIALAGLLAIVLLFSSNGCAIRPDSTKPAAMPYRIVAQPDPKQASFRLSPGMPGLRGKYGLFDVSFNLSLLPRGGLFAYEDSVWYANQRAFYSAYLKKRQYDVLVVPFQTLSDGIDQAGRVLMTYRLAAQIEAQTDLTVAPLHLVYPYLGGHSRFLDEKLVYNLADRLEVSSIVWGYAGYTKPKNSPVMHARIAVIKQSGATFSNSSPSEILQYRKIPMSASELPSTLFEQKLGHIMQFLLGPGFVPVRKNETVAFGDIPQVPTSIKALLNPQAENCVSASFYLQLIGKLIPKACDDHRTYLFVRSLAVISHIDKNHPVSRLLHARAYHYLHRRPAAAALLKNAQMPEETALLHYLNGNLPELATAIEALKPSIAKLMSQIEYYELFEKYNKRSDEEQIARFVKQYPGWSELIRQKIDASDLWKQHSNIELKAILDDVFPVKGYSLKQLINAETSGYVHDIPKTIELSFRKHIQLSMQANKDKISSLKHMDNVNVFDIQTMFDGVGLSNLMRRARFLRRIQGLPSEALTYCEDLLRIYKGHPYLTILKVRAMADSVKNMQGLEKSNTTSEIYRQAKNVFYWTNDQNWAFRSANYHLYNYGRYPQSIDHRRAIWKLELTVAKDFPPRPFCVRHLNLYPPEDLIQWSNANIKDLSQAVENLLEKKKVAEAKALLERYNDRFNGYPKKFRLQVKLAEASDDIQTIKQLYQNQIDGGSEDWVIYKQLAKVYIDEGDYELAADIYHRYPLLKDEKKVHSVQRSNRAFTAGRMLYWKGAWRLARPFFEYSASLNNGSGAGFIGAANVALMDRQFKAAAESFLQHARRYDINAYSYTQYMCALHLLGDSEKAWDLFNTLLGRYETPHIWNAAWVGHRLQASGKEKLKQWFLEVTNLSKSSVERSLPARFALMCLIDRRPDDEMVEFINTVDNLKKYKFTRVDAFFGPRGEKIGPGRLGIPKAKTISELMETPPESIYGSFAKAYEMIKKKKYEHAYDILYERSRYYSYRLDPLTKCFQSYYVWSGLKSGHRKAIETFLRDLGVAGETMDRLRPTDFDAALSCAAYCAIMERHHEALKHIRTAFALRPWTEKRHFDTWYHITELVCWLYEDTGFTPYRDLMLTYSRAYQVIQPWYAWAYALEAKYAKNIEDRIKALAVAQYLDPQSAIVSELPRAMKVQASKWLESHNPFNWRKGKQRI